MFNKEKLLEFFGFLKSNKQRQLNFFLSLFIFCLLPVKNHYTDLDIDIQRPVVRPLAIDLPEISLYPVNVTGQPAPFLTALSALIIDVDSKTIIMQKNPDYQLYPASITKMMTALVSLDHYQLTDILEVKTVNGIGMVMELEQGEKITVENLLYGLLVQSGNDAAYTLAENYPGGLENFVANMNKKAKELHLEKTKFVNTSGIDAYEHLSTTHDLAVLGAEAMKNPIFVKMVATKEIEVTDVSGEKKHLLTNVNKLLGKVTGLKGIKTGWTTNAGECLVSYTERSEKKVITVILVSEDRFGETEKLVKWIFANHEWEKIN